MTAPPESANARGPLGPRDRESFFNAQRRNRRATWRMSALCALAAFVMGVPLTLVITPLFYALTLTAAQIADHFSPLPPEFWRNVNLLGRMAMRVGDFVFNQKPVDPRTLALGSAIVLVPGIVITLVLWMGLLALFRRGGVGGALASMNAREPSKGDLKELQLANVTEEMAIAAGLPAPRVLLVDSPGANAAAIGTSPRDACVVVSRRLLDDLDRDEMQGVLGHLIGSIGNGDLRVAFTVTSVFETCGLLIALINAPFGPRARGALWRILRYGFSRASSETGKAAEAEAVADLLTRNLDMGQDDITQFFDSPQGKKSFLRTILNFVFFPILFTNVAIELTLWFFLNILLGPCMALVWRTRRYLADASAVQLTRYADGLAHALERLSGDGTAIPGGAWASHLFIVNPGGDTSAGAARPTPEQLQKAMQAWAAASPDALPGGSSSNPEAPAASGAAPDFNRLRMELMAAQRAAIGGDARAIARLTEFGRAVAAMEGMPGTAHMPDVADLLAARRGDQAAIAKLRALDRQGSAQRASGADRTLSGIQTQSFLSFHPPLKRRLKRLERMGAQIHLEGAKKWSAVTWVVTIVLWLVIGPLLLVALAGMLVVIAMMIMLNLLFLTLWLAVIHGIFGLLGRH